MQKLLTCAPKSLKLEECFCQVLLYVSGETCIAVVLNLL